MQLVNEALLKLGNSPSKGAQQRPEETPTETGQGHPLDMSPQDKPSATVLTTVVPPEDYSRMHLINEPYEGHEQEQRGTELQLEEPVHFEIPAIHAFKSVDAAVNNLQPTTPSVIQRPSSAQDNTSSRESSVPTAEEAPSKPVEDVCVWQDIDQLKAEIQSKTKVPISDTILVQFQSQIDQVRNLKKHTSALQDTFKQTASVPGASSQRPEIDSLDNPLVSVHDSVPFTEEQGATVEEEQVVFEKQTSTASPAAISQHHHVDDDLYPEILNWAMRIYQSYKPPAWLEHVPEALLGISQTIVVLLLAAVYSSGHAIERFIQAEEARHSTIEAGKTAAPTTALAERVQSLPPLVATGPSEKLETKSISAPELASIPSSIEEEEEEPTATANAEVVQLTGFADIPAGEEQLLPVVELPAPLEDIATEEEEPHGVETRDIVEEEEPAIEEQQQPARTVVAEKLDVVAPEPEVAFERHQEEHTEPEPVAVIESSQQPAASSITEEYQTFADQVQPVINPPPPVETVVPRQPSPFADEEITAATPTTAFAAPFAEAPLQKKKKKSRGPIRGPLHKMAKEIKKGFKPTAAQ